MSYIGSKPANKPVVASDLDPTVITGQTALATSPASTDEFLISDAGVLKRLDASLIGGGGLTEADQWRLSADLTLATSATDITANWERVDTSGYGQLGDGMTESSGIFTFPSTGIYLINMKMSGNGGATNYIGNQIFTTTDNSSYVVAADGFSSTNNSAHYYSTFNQHIFDVTSTSTHKVKFKQFKQGSNTVVANGSTAHSVTYAMFIKLGDT